MVSVNWMVSFTYIFFTYIFSYLYIRISVRRYVGPMYIPPMFSFMFSFYLGYTYDGIISLVAEHEREEGEEKRGLAK